MKKELAVPGFLPEAPLQISEQRGVSSSHFHEYSCPSVGMAAGIASIIRISGDDLFVENARDMPVIRARPLIHPVQSSTDASARRSFADKVSTQGQGSK